MFLGRAEPNTSETLCRSVQGLAMWGDALAGIPLISPTESAAKQLDVIHTLTKEQNGKFLSYEKGEELAY